MPPAPSTPTPRRFLLSKKPAQLQDETPILPRTGPQQFRATPRFAPSSASRPSTQSFGSSVRKAKARPPDPIHDTVESSQPSSPPVAGSAYPDVEVESEIVSESPVSHSESELRPPKRRRISITPEADTAFPDPLGQHNDSQAVQEDDPRSEASVGEDTGRSGSEDESVEELGEPDTCYNSESDGPSRRTKRQPTFHQPPRFKPTEAEGARQEGLPEVFSPQGRKAKYVPGGLAAELQSWLSAVKGWEGDEQRGGGVRMLVYEVHPSDGNMYLVQGRISKNGAAASPVRSILAGEGRLTGLGRRATVVAGSVVVVWQPTWDVDLGSEGLWMVACDWELFQEGSAT